MAFQVLFTPVGAVHERTVDRWAAIFEDAAVAGDLDLPFEGGQLAELFVRLGESMLWADLLGSRALDRGLWEAARRSLFRLG